MIDISKLEKRTFAPGERVQFLDDDAVFIIRDVFGNLVTLTTGKTVDVRELTLC